MTPSEIETSTFQFLGQCHNQLRQYASPTFHLSLEWSMTLMYVLCFYLVPLQVYLDLSMALTPVLSLSVAVTFVLGLTCKLDICPWPYTWPWYLSLTFHVTLIYVLGITRDPDICPWPYMCPWCLSLVLPVTLTSVFRLSLLLRTKRPANKVILHSVFSSPLRNKNWGDEESNPWHWIIN
jgi:hypothetical protein